MISRILVSGNCQTGGITQTLRALLPGAVVFPFPLPAARDIEKTEQLADELAKYDIWVTQDANRVLSRLPDLRVVPMPAIQFEAFHPDLTFLYDKDTGTLVSPPYNSAIIAWSYKHGLSKQATATLFTEEVFEALGYFEQWEPSMMRLRTDFSAVGLDVAEFILPIKRQGLFMYSVNHPRTNAMTQLGKLVAREITGDLKMMQQAVDIDDGLSVDIWPVYPGVGEALGLPSSLIWKRTGSFYDLDAFIDQSFHVFAATGLPPDNLAFLHGAERVARLDAVLGQRSGR